MNKGSYVTFIISAHFEHHEQPCSTAVILHTAMVNHHSITAMDISSETVQGLLLALKAQFVKYSHNLDSSLITYLIYSTECEKTAVEVVLKMSLYCVARIAC